MSAKFATLNVQLVSAARVSVQHVQSHILPINISPQATAQTLTVRQEQWSWQERLAKPAQQPPIAIHASPLRLRVSHVSQVITLFQATTLASPLAQLAHLLSTKSAQHALHLAIHAQPQLRPAQLAIQGTLYSKTPVWILARLDIKYLQMEPSARLITRLWWSISHLPLSHSFCSLYL